MLTLPRWLLAAGCWQALTVPRCTFPAACLYRPYFLPCLLAGVLSAIATIMTIVGLEETLPSRRTAAPAPGRAGGGGGKARYEAVPTADAGEAAAPGGLGEVELGGLRRQDSSQGGGLWGGSDGGDGGSPGKAPCGGRDKGRPFRGDSARIRAAWGQPSPPPPAPGSDAGSGAGSRRGSSRGSLGSLEADVVVLGPGDLEQGQERQEQGRLLAGGATAAEAASEAAPAQAAAPAADLPWYRQRTVVLSLLGYGLIAFVFNMLGEWGAVGGQPGRAAGVAGNIVELAAGPHREPGCCSNESLNEQHWFDTLFSPGSFPQHRHSPSPVL